MATVDDTSSIASSLSSRASSMSSASSIDSPAGSAPVSTSSSSGDGKFITFPSSPTPVQTTCQNCATTTTPLWRRDESGSVLCNACGLFLKLHNKARPIHLKTDTIKSRNRKSSHNHHSSHPNQPVTNDNGISKQHITPKSRNGGAAVQSHHSSHQPSQSQSQSQSAVGKRSLPATAPKQKQKQKQKQKVKQQQEQEQEQEQKEEFNEFKEQSHFQPSISALDQLSHAAISLLPSTPSSSTTSQPDMQSLKIRVTELELVNDLYKTRMTQLERANDELTRTLELYKQNCGSDVSNMVQLPTIDSV